METAERESPFLSRIEDLERRTQRKRNELYKLNQELKVLQRTRTVEEDELASMQCLALQKEASIAQLAADASLTKAAVQATDSDLVTALQEAQYWKAKVRETKTAVENIQGYHKMMMDEEKWQQVERDASQARAHQREIQMQKEREQEIRDFDFAGKSKDLALERKRIQSFIKQMQAEMQSRTDRMKTLAGERDAIRKRIADLKKIELLASMQQRIAQMARRNSGLKIRLEKSNARAHRSKSLQRKIKPESFPLGQEQPDSGPDNSDHESTMLFEED